MKKSEGEKGRLSIDVPPDEHKQIKIYAALHGKSIREYVLESIRERLREEVEERHLSAMTNFVSPVLKELWDNEKDDAYDNL